MTATVPHSSVNSAQGIDISDFQPVYAGTPAVDFLFFKATEGLTWQSATFPGNLAKARALGLPAGFYHFLHPGLSGAAQARFFLDYVKRHGGLRNGDQLVVDSELMAGVRPVSPRSSLGLDLGQPPTPALQAAATSGVDGCTRLFLDTLAGLVDRKRHALITYTMEAVGQHLHATAAAHPLLWFAHPAATAPTQAQIAPFRRWRYWQWGIVAGTDRDAYNGTAAELATWLGGFTHPGPYRHLADGTQSLAQIAASRGTTPARLAGVSAGAYTPADLAVLAALPLPEGAPYYTSNP